MLLVLSFMTTALAAEFETPQETHDHDGIECTHDHEETEPQDHEEIGTPTDATGTPQAEQELPYTILRTWDGKGIAVFGPVEEPKPGIVPFIVGSRPCLFLNCPNSVTVTGKTSFVCNTHKCSVAGCPWVYWQTNPKLCQVHAGITNVTCQSVEDDGSLCGLPSVGGGSPCCWYHHCPGCFGLGNGNGTLCDLCRQCWVPGCPNPSTCTNECDLHCPHTCKVHHQNHCTTCHADPCVCYPTNPTITVKTWNSTDNSVAVDIASARATAIELYTAGGTLFATLSGASGTYTFRHNAAQKNGSYYIRVKNAKGYNSSNFPFTISTLDVVAPVITGKTVQPDNSVWASSKMLTVTATDMTNTIFSLRYADGSTVPSCPDKVGSASGSTFIAAWTLMEQLTAARTFKIIASDKWGYSSETTVTVSGIDNKKPAKPTVSLSNGEGWHKDNVTVTISGSSADSGVVYYQYRINGGVWQTGGTVVISPEGIHTVEAKAVSGVGLESDIESITVKIDKTAPTAIYSLSPEGWTTGEVIITLTSSDVGGSWLASVLLPDGRMVYDLSKIQYVAQQNGDFHFTVFDAAGNSAVVSVPVSNIAILDITATLAVPFTISPDSGKLYAGNISIVNNSNVPISVTLQSMTPCDGAPELVSPNAKAWSSLTASETERFLALGFIGNGVDVWADGQPRSLGTIGKGSNAGYAMQGRFGFAWEQAESFLYGMAIKITIAG